MAQWPVPAEALMPYLPGGVELDSHSGKTYVSLVGLQFADTRVLGVGVPLHRNFVEVNLRFYVRRDAPEGVRRGVVFISEYVPRFWVAFVARCLYNERYASVPMRAMVSSGGGSFSWQYCWTTQGRENRLAAAAHGDPQPMRPGSREEYIAEHYWGYSSLRRGGTAEYRVRHEPWLIWDSAQVSLDWSPQHAYGSPWGEILSAPPEFAFVAAGSPVTVSWGDRIA